MDKLQSKLEQIESAIARGVLKVRHGEEMVEYRSLSEMIRIANRLKQMISKTSNSKTIQLSFSKGL